MLAEFLQLSSRSKNCPAYLFYFVLLRPFFDVLLTVHLSVFILVINQLDAQNLFYNRFISKLYYTASGIITSIGVMIPEVV